MTQTNSNEPGSDRDDKNPCHQQSNGTTAGQELSKSRKQVELDFCLEEKGPSAAKKFNALIAKTLKLQE